MKLQEYLMIDFLIISSAGNSWGNRLKREEKRLEENRFRRRNTFIFRHQWLMVHKNLGSDNFFECCTNWVNMNLNDHLNFKKAKNEGGVKNPVRHSHIFCKSSKLQVCAKNLIKTQQCFFLENTYATLLFVDYFSWETQLFIAALNTFIWLRNVSPNLTYYPKHLTFLRVFVNKNRIFI